LEFNDKINWKNVQFLTKKLYREEKVGKLILRIK